MKRYLHFSPVFDTISNINNSLCIEDNHISFAVKTANSNVKATVNDNFYGKVNGITQFKNYESGINLNSNKAAHFYFLDQISNNFLLAASLSSMNFNPEINEIKSNEFYLPKSLCSISAKYSRPNKSTICVLQLGIRKDRSPISLLYISGDKFNCSAKAIFTDRTNRVYTSILLHGFLASFKFDVYLSQLQGIECGYLYRKNGSNKAKNNNSFFVLYNLYKKNLEFGGFGLFGNKKIAASGNYELKSKEFSIQFGGLLFDSGELRLKFNSKQQIEFLTKLSLKPWVDVSFKTTSTVSKSVIKSVSFGWSLDFHKDF